MATILEPGERVSSIKIEGLALLKIVKHCQEALPAVASGSLLGLTVGGSVLEITHAFPFPEPRSDKSDFVKAPGESGEDNVLEGHEFQLEMMRMLREVNVDNNCVGWYQTMYLGSYSTSTLLEHQFSYQTDLSPNAVVILYDPMQTANGQLVLKCLRLTDECVALKKAADENPKGSGNAYLDPQKIFEEIPVSLTNPSLVRALLLDVSEGAYHGMDMASVDTTFDRLDLNTNAYLEKHLERLCTWVDELSNEQQKFQYYTRNLRRAKESSDDAGSSAPRRMESLLLSNQIRTYCDQVDKFAESGFGKLFLAGGLHKEQQPVAAAAQDHSK